MDNCKPFMYSSKEMVFKHNSVECLIYRPFGANDKHRLKCSKNIFWSVFIMIQKSLISVIF